MTGEASLSTLWIFGAGGHGRQVAWLAQEAFPGIELAFVVDDARYANEPVYGIPVREFSELPSDATVPYITAVGDAELRRRAVAAFTARGLAPATLVYPGTIVAPSAVIGEGSLVAAGSVVTDNVTIGAHVIVNLGCTLSHDVDLRDFATISPGVHIAGHVVVEEGAFIGVGASIINGSPARPLVIGKDAIVGAGAVVTRDVAPRTTVVGVPARPIRSGGRS